MATIESSNLFVSKSPISQATHGREGNFALRDYQREDADEIMRLWFEEGYQGVIERLATGGGKSVVIAEMARRMAQHGRVLVTVDVTTLADDLTRTIYRHTGQEPGILSGDLKEGLNRRVVVATVQSLYSGEEDDRTYERLYEPSDFAALLVDECETSIADRYSQVVSYFLKNPDLKLMGCSATPFRGDGAGMGKLYDYAADEAGPLNRDILWCRDNGWLVNLKQGFVHTDVDFSSLKLRKDASGDSDYSESDLARLIEEEADLRKLAHSIHDAANGEPAIVVCPNSTSLCDKLAGHLDAIEEGCARSVHGKQGREANEQIRQFQRGDYQIIVSVKKLEKGFDADRVKHCFACRKTKSRRLYEQWAGRAVRPLQGVRPSLAEAESSEERRQLIAESDKPHATMWDLVGVNEKAKDLLGVVDILNGSGASESARARAKQKMLEYDGEQDTEEATREAEAEEREEERKRQEEEERRKRRLIQTSAKSHTEVTDDLRAKGGGYARSDVPTRHLETLQKGKWPEDVIANMTASQIKENAKKQVARWKLGLCSYKQAKFLLNNGYTKDQVRPMKNSRAQQLIKEIIEGNK